jgi:hypothetical protein
MPKTRQRGTGVRIRSEAKAAAADRLLMAAQEGAAAYDYLVAQHETCPKWKWLRRRRNKAKQFVVLREHLNAVRSAQEIARKGREVEL